LAFICYNNSNNDKLLTFGPFWFSEKQEQNKIDMVDKYQMQTKQAWEGIRDDSQK